METLHTQPSSQMIEKVLPLSPRWQGSYEEASPWTHKSLREVHTNPQASTVSNNHSRMQETIEKRERNTHWLKERRAMLIQREIIARKVMKEAMEAWRKELSSLHHALIQMDTQNDLFPPFCSKIGPDPHSGGRPLLTNVLYCSCIHPTSSLN